MADQTSTTTTAVGLAVASSSVAAQGSVQVAAATAEKVIESAMKVEPMVAGIAGMFIPGLSMVQPWLVMAAPFLERALTDIANNNGGDILGAFMEMMQHISKGQPNSPALGSATADPSAQGSG